MNPGTYQKPTGLYVTHCACGCRLCWRVREGGRVRFGRVDPCGEHTLGQAFAEWEIFRYRPVPAPVEAAR